MTNRRWLKSVIAEAAKPQPAPVFSRDTRSERSIGDTDALRATA